MQIDFADYLLAAGNDEDVALIDGGAHYTYAQLREAARVILDRLGTLGVAPGSRIALIGRNSFFWVAGYLAAMKLGVVVPLAEKISAEELAVQLDWAECSAVLIDRGLESSVMPALAGRTVVTDAPTEGETGSPWPAGTTSEDTDAALMFTSGTTSRPKAVRVTHGNLAANTGSIISYLGLQRSDRVLVILPFHYVFGASLLHTHLAVGASLVLCHSFTFPETALELIERQRCTVLAGVPSSFNLLLRASSYRTRVLPTLRVVQQAGGKLADSLLMELAAAQPQSQLFVMYGQTEATARLSYLPPEMLAEKLGSVGRGIPGVSLSVVGEGGAPVAPGEIGEIIARGANISPGYLNDPAETALRFPGGALRTGDLARVDSDGFIYIVGRQADFIKSWGYRIAPAQIEDFALEIGGIVEAAAVGVPDQEAGEAIILAVVAQSGPVDPETVLAALREKLPRHMVPKEVRILDSLPLTASGKVSKPELRSQLGSALSWDPTG